ncbi:hypothetical protein TEA_007889 [Camellia sinensis var. sinensis]|uniref:RING-type E3 ubiquitin transferase n=2 Tax=Camellia sinensis TaxID=4442 RepID=A0A4S4DXF3_CAMSN|nr:hypothetical protein TEA_007889 [Camellia sinensis var. sinensis]
MARIKPQALLQQSKKKKDPSCIGATTVILYSLIIVVMVFFLFSTYRHWTQNHRKSNNWIDVSSPNSPVVVAALAAEAELAEETEQLQEGVLESAVVVTPTKPKKGKAALPLKNLVIVTVGRLERANGVGACGKSTPEMEALKLAPCAMAKQDEKSDVPDNSCQQVKKLGQNPGCLCAVMLSDTAKFLSNLRYVLRGLLALEDQIGNMSTGLSEEAILAAVRQHCYLSMKLGPPVEEEPCCICQEDYVDGKELGKLNCGHEFHFNCIKQWLVQKNNCPICRKTAVVV